ncbi:uncharacterized protein LOC131256108 [Magnolia sinica]|uniref:uncharacterized protein LOC131256108 n=1 Tax=Magnolia sinica TaxID=86752 RepID=UPI002657FFEE|nr:uncharacterized protein LOC131256108 [Magnolia sinica]
MPTRTKDGTGHGREKSSISPSTPQNIDAQHGRTPRSSSKSSVSGLPGKDSSTSSEKPVPHYLKPTISSTLEAHKIVKKPASEGPTTKSLTTRRSFEKPPSPSRTPKAPLSTGSKEKQLKMSLSLPKTSSSTKPILGKMVRTAGKAKSTRKEVGIPKKKETKATSTSTTTSTSHEGEEKEVIHDVTVEELKADDEEHAQVEIPMVQDQTPDNAKDADQNILNKACNASPSLDEHEVGTTDEEVDEKIDENTEGEGDHEVKEEEDRSDGEPNHQHFEESLVREDHEVTDKEHGEEGVDKKLKIEIKKVITNPEDGDGKDIDNAGSNEQHDGDMEGSPHNTNATPKHTDIRGKKEVPQAYNDVIEETASKLAGQRKSKVRALAGAFETVISLQNPEG